MSLFGTIQIANNSLTAASVGLQVTGNNIANSNTPGYLRQEPHLVTGPTQLVGRLPLGLGVRVAGIIQHVDEFLSERLRNATSDLSNSEAQEDVYLKLEAVLGELNDSDLSSSLNSFFGAVNDVMNQPESIAVRNLAILKGQSLANDIHRFSSRVRDVRSEVNDLVSGAAVDINGLIKEIADLNVQIVAVEGGEATSSDAVGLRDRRGAALQELASIVDIRAVEQPTGAVTVFAGGDFLVAEGIYRPVTVGYSDDRALSVAEVRLAETDSPLPLVGGRLAGLTTARDTILGGVLDQFDTFTGLLINEFNKVYSSGQGLTGYSQLTSEFSVDATDTALDESGLPFTPENGSFRVLARNKATGATKTTDVFVRLAGLDDDTTAQDLVDQLDAIDGIGATLTANRQIRITSDSSQMEFAFSDDTSGALAALGINTFFSGSRAADIGVSTTLRSDPGKFAASRGGIGADGDNVETLAGLQNRALDSLNGGSIASTYHALAANITQGSSVTHAVTEGFRTFQKTLEGQALGISGVSVDDETVRMIQYQRMYQASARVISTIDSLLETLINL